MQRMKRLLGSRSSLFTGKGILGAANFKLRLNLGGGEAFEI